MKKIFHQLTDRSSEKVINLRLNNKTLISETGKVGKTKSREKEFPNEETALKNFYKKEWESLKKGFVLTNETAEIGHPILHKFIGGGYTGSLSFEQTPNGIYIYKNADQAVNGMLIDKFVLIDNFGLLIDEVDLPKPLAWDIEYRTETNSLLLDVDHFIYEFDIDNNTFTNLGNDKSNQTSFISVSNNRIAFASLDKYFILDNSNKVLFSHNYDIETIKGTTPFCGKLSNDGKLLAFHNKVGVIQILDTATGKLLNKIETDFEMINQFEFAHNNDLLVVREQYGTWGMRYFDLTTNKEIKIEELEIPEYTKEVNTFCFNPTQSKLVLRQYNRIHVFDFIKRELLHSFEIEHIVKNCKMKFIGERLGVRTDYGCFSLYNV